MLDCSVESFMDKYFISHLTVSACIYRLFQEDFSSIIGTITVFVPTIEEKSS